MAYALPHPALMAKVAQRYIAWIERHVTAILIVFVLALLGSTYLVMFRLPLRADFSYLLPKDAPSVRAAEELAGRMPQQDTMLMLIVAPSPVMRARATTQALAGLAQLDTGLIEVARTVVAFGFDSNCSLVRDETGALITPDAATRGAYDEIRGLGHRLPSFMDDDYTKTLLDQGTMEWKCRAGARTFLVDENGVVQLCQPRATPDGKQLLAYTVDDIRAAFDAPKPCAATCPIAYAHHASKLDAWRSQKGAPILVAAPAAPALPAGSTGRRVPALSVVA